ncbi:transcriptional repressor LexA [Thiomicrorhabdus sp. ZW0627]|uniref:transcriptional repressor LexA n=1 Tax=Thiomicrorhabdus sp. ZW0627 TaxID=3039774 RepID=UPI0024362FC5|nr:transcriptional repressor LexA [Thiomicrorhabdus sp. ZW0627]MDG6772950.1 transcriptional repressor LexA [Thiomicrorhabdus sp. ZW0627]
MSNLAYLIPTRNQKLHIHPQDPVELVEEDFVEIPLLGWTSAGEPIQMELDYDTVAVPSAMVKKETFALRVKGNSMIDENIEDGDIVIIERRSNAENGESVVVRINNEEVTMKKLYIEKTGVRLQPANPDMEPIILRNEEIEILGIVTGILRQP